MDIGRVHNADARWILPLLCRRGHITRGEIGAIRIAANETLFEVPRAVAGRFLTSVKRTANDDDAEGGAKIEAFEGKPREEARTNRRANSGPPQQRYEPKPFGDKPQRPKLGAKPGGERYGGKPGGGGGRPSGPSGGPRNGPRAGGKPGGKPGGRPGFGGPKRPK
jgi:ATP-dependent RNA helicase DeaD